MEDKDEWNADKNSAVPRLETKPSPELNAFHALAMANFRNSVGFQFGFVLYSGLKLNLAIDHVCNAAERLLGELAPTPFDATGLNLFRQLVRGKNALRQLDVFACNDGEHDAGCECFWEQCERWATADAARNKPDTSAAEPGSQTSA